ncbi:hypothetical protein EZS27_033526, partial [termite gut metagenome]
MFPKFSVGNDFPLFMYRKGCNHPKYLFMRFILKLRLLLVIPLLVASCSLSAQNYRIEGTVTDSKTKEALTGVSVYVKDYSSRSTATNNRGNYILNLPKGQNTLIVTYLGYETKQIPLSVTKNTKYDISLAQITIELTEVVISSKRPDASVTDPQTGVTQMEVKQINKLPVLLGERDVIKSLQLMPGIKSAGEGSAGFFVRGGTADQNLILLDNVPLYNASHLMGFFSTFNSDVLRDV